LVPSYDGTVGAPPFPFAFWKTHHNVSVIQSLLDAALLFRDTPGHKMLVVTGVRIDSFEGVRAQKALVDQPRVADRMGD